MKYLKLFSICLLASFAMSISATETARAKIFVQGDITKMPADVFMVEDDATAADFSDPNNGPYLPGGSQFTPKFVAVNGTNEYGAVAIPNLEGLKLKFIANAYETDYTMSFSNVSGTQYFLQKGDDAANLIPMTEDYAFTCAVSAEIIFTVVKQAAPQKDYTRDAATVIGNWYTICVPGGVNFEEYDLVMDVYTVAGYNAEKGLGLNPMTEAMQPGVPYIFQAKATQIAFNYIAESEVSNPVDGTNNLTGTFVETTTSAVAYVVANNMLNWAAAGTTVPAYRAYLNVADITELPIANNAPGRKFLPAPKGVVTGLDGAAINGMKNGKYIMNGRFMIVKDGKTTNVLGL